MSLRERIARTLCRCNGVDPDQIGGVYDGGSLPRARAAWTAWEDDAIAVLKAAREPTEVMVEAGSDNDNGYGGVCGHTVSRDVFRTMIDAALEEEMNK